MKFTKFKQQGVFLGEGKREATEIEGIESMVDFKFEIGDKVHSTAYGYNAVVTRRIYMEEADGSKIHAYDIAIWESNPPTHGEYILEQWLEKGFRVE